MAKRSFTAVFKDEACGLVTGQGYTPALVPAIEARRPGKGLLHHSDRGVQYTSEAYGRLLNENGIDVSLVYQPFAVAKKLSATALSQHWPTPLEPKTVYAALTVCKQVLKWGHAEGHLKEYRLLNTKLAEA